MKVICDRGALLEAVNTVGAVVPARTPTPVLGCLRLVAEKASGGSTLTISGFDGEIALDMTLDQVDVTEPGQVLIPADKLRQIVSAEEGEATLELSVDGDLCHIKGEGAHFRVFVYPARDYPALPAIADAIAGTGAGAAKTVITQPTKAITDLIDHTAFATARETSRYAINGVLLKRDGKKLEMVATDGRRLALARTTISGQQGKGEAPTSCIIPTKALNLVSKIARDPEEPLRLVITGQRAFFAFDRDEGSKAAPRAVLSTNLVDGAFPPYDDVIPRDQDKKIVADRDELSRAVRKAAVLTNEESRGVRMSFKGSEKSLTLSSRAPEQGEAEINVKLDAYEGTDIEISFNPQFITDVLKVVEEPQVIVELKAPNKPGLIRSSGNDFVYVVMPVNLPQ